MLSVGLESKGEQGLTTVRIPVQGLDPPPSRHQYTPAVTGLVYTIAVRAVDDVRGVSSPVMSVAWRVGDDICECNQRLQLRE